MSFSSDIQDQLDQEIRDLKTLNAELEAKLLKQQVSVDYWSDMFSHSLYGTMGVLEAAAIEEACRSIKTNSWDFGDYLISAQDLKEYAANLKAEEVK